MFDTKILDDLANRLVTILPSGALELHRDLEKNIRAVLASAFAKLDLVSREEFEVQKILLERTQERLLELERQIAVLTASNNHHDSDK